MIVNVNSRSDCQQLVDRIRQTLAASGYNMGRIQNAPSAFAAVDADVLEGLSRAILTRQANWSSVVRILPALKASLLNYDVHQVAALTNGSIGKLYTQYKSRVKARFLQDELLAIRDNAEVFKHIVSVHGSVLAFIQSYLSPAAYDPSCRCYIRPGDAALMESFTKKKSAFKLRTVGLAICCEFFNNIGIDEFKPDVHTTRFLNRTKIVTSMKQSDVRGAGIAIAETLQLPRKYVDSHIWVFCAEGEGEVCTEKKPQCHACLLKTKQPQLCQGC